MKTIAEQIAALEATREAKQARMEEILQKSQDEERTTDTAEAEEFDTIESEIKKIDGDLVRLRKMERVQAVKSKAAKDVADEAANQRREPGINTLQIKHKEKLEPGIRFARYARCIGMAHEKHRAPEVFAERLYPDDTVLHDVLEKAAVPAANSTDSAFAAVLITDGAVFADFVDYLRPRTLLGQVEGRLRRLPFDVPVAIQSTSGTGYWVGEGKAKPLTSWGYTETILRPQKVASIAVATRELLWRASADVDMLIRDELARSIADRLNADFIDPLKAANTPTASPGSILNGVSATTANGATDYAGVLCDVEALISAFVSANQSLEGAFWVMPEALAVALTLMRNELGQQAFPGVSYNGGTLASIPVITSNYVPTTSLGSVVALVRGSDIFFGDRNGIDVRVSDQASLEMDTEPTSDSAPSGAVTETTQVSMFQTNSVAFLVEREINWARRRAEAVAWMEVFWSACTES